MNEWHIYIVNKGRISLLGRVLAHNEYNAKLAASKKFGVEDDESLVARQTPYPESILSPLLEVAPEEPKLLSEKEKEKLIAKARKLLALSKSPNEHEAARAAERVQALVAEYNLSMLDVLTVDETRREKIVIDASIVTASNPWRRRLANATAALYLCGYYYVPKEGSRNAHCFAGTESNVMVTKLMFDYLLTAINRLASEGARALPERERSPYRVSFREACTSRLCARIHERIEAAKEGGKIKTESGTTLPALRSLYEQAKQANDEAITQRVGKLKTRRSRIAYLHSKGVSDGLEAGDRISLDQQIAHERAKRIAR